MLLLFQVCVDYLTGMAVALSLTALGVLVGWGLLRAVHVLFGKGRGQ